MGGCGQRQRLTAVMGHVRRPREGSSVRIRPLRCRPPLFLHQQPSLTAELQVDVVSGDKEILSPNTCAACWMQK